MNYLALSLILLIVLVSGCAIINNGSSNLSDALTSDEVLSELDSVLVDESDGVEIGSII
ncbi:MAG: hypothetical protein PHT91_01115 [Candidatus Nanoarchaeia archaeon]|nr:hypothetical protein [Candidatus Nanoarchaeia archaeon]MDD5054040.1 hypothetical protein [Candidatus Nanoarchaeia archaeon]MDD5499458.1 hypothetical protein [Candidatus Nanoarchaeia archaeon]